MITSLCCTRGRLYLGHSSGRRDHGRVAAWRRWWWRRCSRWPCGGGPGGGDEDTRYGRPGGGLNRATGEGADGESVVDSESRFLGVRVTAASAVEVGIGRGGGGAGLGRASRLNVLNGRRHRRRRLYASGPPSISPKTPRSRATGAARAHPKTNSNEIFFFLLPSFPPNQPTATPSSPESLPSSNRQLLLLLLLLSLLSLFIFLRETHHPHSYTHTRVTFGDGFTPHDIYVCVCVYHNIM